MQVELAAAAEKGKLCFSELEVIAILRIYTHNKCFVTEGRCFFVENFTAATINKRRASQQEK